MNEINVTSESTNIVWHYFLYGGSLTDILINYSLLLIYSLALLLPWQGCLRPRVLFSLLHTGLCVSLQVGCWVLAEAYGISLVWCGQMGQLTIIIMEMVLSGKTILVYVEQKIRCLLQMWSKPSREMYSKLIFKFSRVDLHLVNFSVFEEPYVRKAASPTEHLLPHLCCEFVLFYCENEKK